MTFYKRSLHLTLWVALVLACLMTANAAWAKAPYSRDQVERHLRTMFPLKLSGFSDFSELSPKERLDRENLLSFHAFTDMETIQIQILDLKPDEYDTALAMLQEIQDITQIPFEDVNAEPWDFDLLIIVFDDIATQALHPGARQFLQGEKTIEEYEHYLNDLTGAGHQYMGNRIMRDENKPLVIVTTQRYRPLGIEVYPISLQLRFILFNALTSASPSDVIKPSVVNRPGNNTKSKKFFPIDQAILRVIYSHHDWSDLAYGAKIRLLTDRVMEQLTITP